MSLKKISNIEKQLDSIRHFIIPYLKEHGYDVEHGHKISCLSPDHNDSNPSMSAFESEEGYHLIRCHGCGVTMDIFNAAHIIEDKPIIGPGFINDTVTYLADKYGVELQYKNLSDEEVYELNMYQAYDVVAKYISSQTDFNNLQMAELDKRQFSKEFIKSYMVGVCNDYHALRKHLLDSGFTNSFIDEIDLGNTNLFSPNNLIYTICDDFGRPVAFMARNLIYDGVVNPENNKFVNGPKFTGSKTSIKKNIYRKNERLYLLHLAKKLNKSIYIVEGNSDALSLHNAGIKNVVGICGLDLSEHHFNTLRRNSCYDITICLDNDDAGKSKARKMLDTILATIHDIKIKFVFLPDEYDADGNKVKIDPDEYIRKYGIDEFLSLDKIDSFVWRLEQFEEDDDQDYESITLKMVPIIVSEPSSIKREKMIHQLSLYTGYSEKSIRDEIGKIESIESRRIANSKEAVLSGLVKKIQNGSIDAEILLTNAVNDLHQINKSSNSSILDPSTRINNLLAIKDYQEDPDVTSNINLGDDMSVFNAAMDGDISGKVIFVGGGSNVGKTALLVNLIWRMAKFNDNICIPFLSIDDSAKEILPRLACTDAAYRAYYNGDMSLFNLLNINKFAKPTLYSDAPAIYGSIMEERDIFYKQMLEYSREEKMTLYDSTDGRSITFIETIIRNYREKYPNRRIIFVLDNFHLVQLDSDISGREKYQMLSAELKSIVVKYNATIISTVEYTKMPLDQKPDNNNIAESVSLVYDSNMIWHGFNELHGLKDKATAYFYGGHNDDYKYPLIEFGCGKNKISSFKGNDYFKFYPDKSFYMEISEDTFKSIKEANKMNDEAPSYARGDGDN